MPVVDDQGQPGVTAGSGSALVDAPSANWLGRRAARPLVRDSGLWQVDYAQDPPGAPFLDVLAGWVRQVRQA